MKKELENLIEKEETKNLINIHNFLTSVFICPKKEEENNLSVFALSLKLMIELTRREEKEEIVKKYFQLMDKGLN